MSLSDEGKNRLVKDFEQGAGMARWCKPAPERAEPTSKYGANVRAKIKAGRTTLRISGMKIGVVLR